MRRRSQRHELRLITELSLTPLLGLFTILFLVFLLVLPLSKESAASPGPSTVAHLSIDKAGTMALEGRKTSREALKDELAGMLKTHPGTGVMVQVDRDLPAQQLLDLMAVLRHAGVQKTAVTTTEK